jgi:hypothetical protein
MSSSDFGDGFVKALKSAPPEALAVMRRTKIQDVIVRFLGYNFRQGFAKVKGNSSGEEVGNVDEKVHPLINTEYQKVLTRLKGDADYMKTHQPPLMKCWRASFPGDGRGGLNLKAALQFIQENFDPRGQVHVIGESMGGENAVRLCKYLQEDFPNVEVDLLRGRSPDQLRAMLRASPNLWEGWWRFSKSPGSRTAKVRVDRLTTLDAAWDKDNPAKDCTNPADVQYAVNYWQDEFDTDDQNRVAAKHGAVIAPGDDTSAIDFPWSDHVANEADKHNKLIGLAHIPTMASLERSLKLDPPAELEPICPPR